MEQLKYDTFEENLGIEHPFDLELRDWAQSLLEGYINHQHFYAAKGLYLSPNDKRYLDLYGEALLAEKVLQRGDIHETALAFLKLGQAIERAKSPGELKELENEIEHSKRAIELNKLRLEDYNRQLPLIEKKCRISLLKSHVQKAAKMIWEQDTKEEKRLADVCREIYPHIRDYCEREDVSSLLPGYKQNNPDKLKPWLQEIAPDYSRVAGRPKK